MAPHLQLTRKYAIGALAVGSFMSPWVIAQSFDCAKAVGPVGVLARSPNSGVRLASPSQIVWHSSTDLPAWAAAQKPPFSVSPDLLGSLKMFEQSGGGGKRVKALGVDFYSITRSEGSMGCS